jgi:glucose/arabinose dehydrogenase
LFEVREFLRSLYLLLVLSVLNVSAAGVITTSASTIATKDPNLEVELILDGLDRPISMAFLGSDDILVTEKDEGTVRRILNGNIQNELLLDLDVANSVERGLLGLSITNETGSDRRGNKTCIMRMV